MSDNKRIHRIGFRLTAVIFYGLLFYHFGARINPALIFRNQEPVFFTTLEFFRPFAGYAGGPAEYVAAFLSQFFIFRWIGALILIALTGGVQLFSFHLFRNAAENKPIPFASFLPPALLAVMLSHYDFPLASAVGLPVSLCFSILLLRMKNGRFCLFLPVLAGTIILSYYLIAGPYWIVVAISGLAVWSARDKSILQKGILSGVVILVGLGFPWLLNPAPGVMPLDTSCFKWIPLSVPFAWHVLPLLLFGFIILWSVIQFLMSKWKSSRLITIGEKWPSVIVRALAVTGLVILILTTTVDEMTRSRLSIRLHARQKNWDGVLEEIRKRPDVDAISSFHMHRALYHTGRLGDDMFRYPQNFGIDGLIPLKEDLLFHAVEAAEFWFEMAHFNEAEHWAHEAITQQGATPWILLRLAEINAIKANRPMLNSCTKLLDQTLLQRKWADPYEAQLGDPASLEDQPAVRRARVRWIKSDFLIHLNLPEMDFVSLYKRNPKNHMAYEYLMAYYLLARQIGWFVDEIEEMRNFPYSRLPIHWEEALLVYMMETKNTDPIFAGFPISPESIQRFNEYQQILARYGGNRQSAHTELRRKYGGTYWYYLMYSESNIRTDADDSVDGSTGATQ
jgi:hypothetical protein